MSEPKHITLPSAPRSTREAVDAFKPYRPKDQDAVRSAKAAPAPAPYEMEPELREWLRTQVRILAYWDSLPASYFVPAMPPATRARDAIILSGLRRLLA
jgi:hypothetical protein